jgi:hypothetical protein
MADKAALDKIDAKFKALYPDNLITDGIVDMASFNKAKRKILWILKEGNDPEQTSWSLQDVILNYLQGSKYWLHTFGLICQLSWAILNDVDDLAKVPPAKDITDTLKQVAVINVKKIGGKSTADYVDVKRFYKEHKALIKEQIEAIAPDIIISCNGIKDILADFKTKGEILRVGLFNKAVYKNGVIRGAYHPAQRSLPHAAYFKNIWDCLKQR